MKSKIYLFLFFSGFFALTLLVEVSVASTNGCDLFLLKSKELNYFKSETLEQRIRAREDFFKAIEEISIHPDDQILTADLNAAWWRVAFERKGAPVPFPGQMEPDELRTLIFSRDRATHLESFKKAYAISEMRMRASLYFDRVGSVISKSLERAGLVAEKKAAEIFPSALRARAESIALKTSKVYSEASRKLRSALPYLQVAPDVSNAGRARTITLYAALKTRSMLMGAADFISPIQLRTFLPERWLERTTPIFSKLERNPAFIPEGEDLRILLKYGALETFEKRKALLLAHPKWFKTIQYGDTGFRWLIAGLGVGAVGIAVYQAVSSDEPVTLEEFLNDPKNKLLPNQVQLLNETVPFPHLAIRIGDTVFSYGVSHMTASSVEVYLREHQPKGDGSGSFWDRERSIQVVTLNLAPEEAEKMRRHFENMNGKAYDFDAIEKDMHPEYRKLRRYLSLQEKKEYKNITLVNDCSTMLVRAFKEQTSIDIPKLIDPSPSSVILYFSSEKFLRNPKVESIRLVLGSKSQNSMLQLLRNAYINTREARLFYHPVAFVGTQIYRGYVDATTSKEELQHFDQSFIKNQKQRSDLVEQEMKGDRDLEYFIKHKKEIAADPEAKRSAKQYFQEVYRNELSRVEGNYSELDQVLSSLYKLEYYSEVEKELLGTKSFDLKKSLNDPEFYSEIHELLQDVRHTTPEN